jgi:phage/plasmid-associated DNA primase
VVSSELEDGKRFAEALIKQLTSGDRVRARRMREDLWEFDPTHTVIVAANRRPEVRGTDKGIWRRIKIVPWEVMIPDGERDPKLPEKLEREQDVLASFIYDECVEGPNVSVKSEPLYRAYKERCELNGEFQQSQKMFSIRLKERGYPKVRKTGGMVWEGIGLRGDGGGGPGVGTDPTSGGGNPAGSVHPEKGLGKPKTDGENDECRVVHEKSGSTPLENPRVGVSTGFSIHNPTSLHSYILLDSDTSVEEAARQRRASR